MKALSGLDVRGIQDEVGRQRCQARIDVLRAHYDAARATRDDARLPMPVPSAVTAAEANVARALAASVATSQSLLVAADSAESERSCLPRGWRYMMEWCTGALTRRLKRLRAAEAVVKAAEEESAAYKRVLEGFRFAVAVQREKAEKAARTETIRRRALEATAIADMKRAQTAARLLRENPGLLDQSIGGLLHLADKTLSREEQIVPPHIEPALSPSPR